MPEKNANENAAPPEIATPLPSAREGGVTPRVVVLCLALALMFGVLSPLIDYKFGGTHLGTAHLPPGVLGVLLILLLIVNPLLRVLARGRFTFSRNELLTVYITCMFSALIPGHGGENFFVPRLIAPFYFATPENKWLDFLRILPRWFTPALNRSGTYDDAARRLVDSWYIGGVVPWAQWLIPLLAWSALIFASYFMLGCLSVMLRAQWAEKEALSFPLLRLPLEMTRDVDGASGSAREPFFRNRLMWIGFAMAALLQIVNGLHVYFPLVPAIPVGIDTAPLLTERPWNQIGWVPVQVFPMAVGITYLLTSEVSFSLWFFVWFVKFQLLVAYSLGFVPSALPESIGTMYPGAKTFIGFQQIGAYFGYVALVLWAGRDHLRHVARRAFGRAASTREEDGEALSYPVAFWGFVASLLFLLLWSLAAGMSLGAALALWICYLVIVLGMTRIVVESGLLSMQQGWYPLQTMAQLGNAGAGTWLTMGSIVPASFVQASMMTDMRGFLMPSFVQGFKLMHDHKIKGRPLFALIVAVIALTMATGFWMNVRLGYGSGGLQLGNQYFATAGAQLPGQVSSALQNGAPDVGWSNWGWLALGVFDIWLMTLLRSRFLWFPLHPVGFLMSVTYPMHMLWCSIFLGWLAKTLITRFGGSETYRKMIPLFLGLVLGDVVTMLGWIAIDAWQGRINHILFFG